jgi:hypothetical protein
MFAPHLMGERGNPPISQRLSVQPPRTPRPWRAVLGARRSPSAGPIELGGGPVLGELPPQEAALEQAVEHLRPRLRRCRRASGNGHRPLEPH